MLRRICQAPLPGRHFYQRWILQGLQIVLEIVQIGSLFNAYHERNGGSCGGKWDILRDRVLLDRDFRLQRAFLTRNSHVKTHGLIIVLLLSEQSWLAQLLVDYSSTILTLLYLQVVSSSDFNVIVRILLVASYVPRWYIFTTGLPVLQNCAEIHHNFFAGLGQDFCTSPQDPGPGNLCRQHHLETR